MGKSQNVVKVDAVVAVSTVNDNFEDVISNLGGVIKYPYNDVITSDFYQVKNFMLDLHSFLDCMYKKVIVKKDIVMIQKTLM